MNGPNEMIDCGCGCGTQIERFGSHGRERRFAYRHRLDPQVAAAWKRLAGPDDPHDQSCWEWQGGVNEHGYGVTKRNGENYAHRAAWVQVKGPIPAGLFVCHRCDNPPCIRPSHLFLGTAADNMQDCLSKGRVRNGAPPPVDEEAMCRQYLSGWSFRQIVAEHHASFVRIRAILLKNGVAIRRPGESRSGTHTATCGKGHARTPENTYVVQKTGQWYCRPCANAAAVRRRRANAGR